MKNILNSKALPSPQVSQLSTSLLPADNTPRIFNRDVVTGLGPWSLIVVKDKTGVLGPGLDLEDMSLVVLGVDDSNATVLLKLVHFLILTNLLNLITATPEQ